MKVLIAVSCLLAVASASVSPLVYSTPLAYAYSGPQHLPVIGPNGVPVDEPAVQARRAEHAAAHIEASARNGDAVVVGATHIAAAAPVAIGYSGPQHLPVIGANGVPVDEPAVQARRAEHAAAHVEASVRNGDAIVASHIAAPVTYAAQHVGVAAPLVGHSNGAIVPAESAEIVQARANHLAAHAEANARNGVYAPLAHVAYTAHHVAAPVAYAAHHVAVAAPLVAHPNGAIVPAESADVVAARANHLAAHAEVSARNGVYAPLVHYRRRRGIYATPLVYSAQHLPVIGANGVPVDEASVQIARAQHAAHHVEAQVRNGDAALVHSSVIAAPSAVAYAAPLAHVSYAGLQHLPVIGANGVPVDEPAVQVARAAHAAQHVEAQVRNGDAAVVAHHIASPVVAAGPIVPAETPEVAVARAAHLAAHAEARAQHGIY